MNGLTASVLDKKAAEPDGPRDLIISVNWIGDAIMAMPALQLYRRLHPDNRITVLARGVLADLWKLNPAPDDVIRYDGRPGIFSPLYATLKRSHDCAWVLPNSFRSALLAFRSGIPERKGTHGGFRKFMLTEHIKLKMPSHHLHQAWETIHMMNPAATVQKIPQPELDISEEAVAAAVRKFGIPAGPVVGMIPGAARGPSKRWPEEHFASLGKRMVREGGSVVLFGGPDDAALCGGLTEKIVQCANLAGRTSMSEWAALMSVCDLVVANDSGGMHLAAALNVPVVALYGMTDPVRTGPIGKDCVILQKSKTRARDIPRNSEEAAKSLAEIRPEEVYEAARPFMKSGSGKS